MKKLFGDLMLTLFGAATTLLTAWVLSLVEQNYEFSFYSFCLLFFIPVGAIASGFAAATGYWIGSKVVNQKPTRRLLVNILILSVGAFFALHFMNYAIQEVQGEPLRQMIGFGDYLRFVHTHTSLSISFHSTNIGDLGELGTAGYFFGALQIAGFAIGGIVVYLIIKAQPYCEPCERFLKSRWTEERFFSDSEQALAFRNQAAGRMQQQQFSELVADYESLENKKATKGSEIRMKLKIWGCPCCTQRLIELEASRLVQNNWAAIPQMTVQAHAGVPVITSKKVI